MDLVERGGPFGVGSIFDDAAPASELRHTALPVKCFVRMGPGGEQDARGRTARLIGLFQKNAPVAGGGKG